MVKCVALWVLMNVFDAWRGQLVELRTAERVGRLLGTGYRCAFIPIHLPLMSRRVLTACSQLMDRRVRKYLSCQNDALVRAVWHVWKAPARPLLAW